MQTLRVKHFRSAESTSADQVTQVQGVSLPCGSAEVKTDFPETLMRARTRARANHFLTSSLLQKKKKRPIKAAFLAAEVRSVSLPHHFRNSRSLDRYTLCSSREAAAFPPTACRSVLADVEKLQARWWTSVTPGPPWESGSSRCG